MQSFVGVDVIVRLVLPLSLLVMACQRQSDPVFIGEEVDALRARHEAFAQALQAKDAEAVGEFYDSSSLIYQPAFSNGHAYVGTELSNQPLFEDPNGSIEFLHTEFETSGALAISRGQCILTRTLPETGQTVQMHGYCVTSWRRDRDDIWRVAWESRNVAPLR